MATFRVGQRVRIVACSNNVNRHLIGVATKIIGRRHEPGFGRVWLLDVPDTYSDVPYTLALNKHLAPLTDPRADEFIERIKKLGREPVGLPQKETVEVRK